MPNLCKRNFPLLVPLIGSVLMILVSLVVFQYFIHVRKYLIVHLSPRFDPQNLARLSGCYAYFVGNI